MMHTIRIALLLLLALPSLSFRLSAQEIEIDHFSLRIIDGEVQLDWVISKGSYCSGISILRGDDPGDMVEIGRIEGVCGSVDQAQSYTFLDGDPKSNQPVFYGLATRGELFSPALEIIVFDFGSKGFRAFPVPVESQTRLYFENEFHSLHHATFLDPSGRGLGSMVSQADFFEIGAFANIPGGIVFFVQDEKGVVVARGILPTGK